MRKLLFPMSLMATGSFKHSIRPKIRKECRHRPCKEEVQGGNGIILGLALRYWKHCCLEGSTEIQRAHRKNHPEA